jgi:hypothetical protein
MILLVFEILSSDYLLLIWVKIERKLDSVMADKALKEGIY